MSIEIQPYFAEGERYPALIGVRVEEDEYETAYVSKGELADALTENAKLRELVLTLAFCANDEADCDQCPMNGARCDVVQQCFCDGVAETLRELGIEVTS